jgi:hypothetical protein
LVFVPEASQTALQSKFELSLSGPRTRNKQGKIFGCWKLLGLMLPSLSPFGGDISCTQENLK